MLQTIGPGRLSLRPVRSRNLALLGSPGEAGSGRLLRCAAHPEPKDSESEQGQPAHPHAAQQQPQRQTQPQQQEEPQHQKLRKQQTAGHSLTTGRAQAGDEEPLWWVEQFEKRRQQQQQQAGHTSPGTAASTSPAGPTTQQSPQRQAVLWLRVVLQLLQLSVAVAALILWPASLYRSGLYSGKVWLLFWTYMLFFGGGSVWRLAKFGPLASRAKDQQAKSLGTRAAWFLFVAMMPILHWGCIGSYIKSRAAAAVAAAAAAAQGASGYGVTGGPFSSLTLYDVIGLALLLGAVALNWAAARHLGRAYDRVVQPEALVTSGPYALVQHPIYSSYMLLFCGYAMVLHSFGHALLALGVCLVYYKSRVALEADVLQAAFGEQYRRYQQRTKLFVPFLL